MSVAPAPPVASAPVRDTPTPSVSESVSSNDEPQSTVEDSSLDDDKIKQLLQGLDG